MKVCFLGGARYGRPLDSTSEKKFKALEALGDVFVIGFSHDGRPRRFSQHAYFYLLPTLPLPVLRYLEMLVIGPVLALWLIFRRGVRVLVAQSPYEGFAAALAKRLARVAGRRVALVVENHGDFEESLFMQRRILLPGLYRFLMGAVAGYALNNADLLRAVSFSTKRQLERWTSGKPIHQFMAWTDIEAFFQSRGSHDEGGIREILYAGMLTPLKGVHHLVNAFSCLARDFPQVRLTIVGREEYRGYAENLRRQVRQLGLEGRVQFVGQVPQAELAVWMSRAFVFVLPSLSEGLGRVVVEAMATGRPVIGSNVGGIPEMVQDGITGFLVPPGDEAALAEKLRWLLEHPVEAGEMGGRARTFAEHFFSTEAYVENYKQILKTARSLLGREEARYASPSI
ncbi:Glycosyl transferase, family 1 [Moorella glycerini]|uniref:D-inositol 3-phosphate glycosyltransferase n=1 Tax=Neomoorella stamsii TaxID=1266720 RepID=A0A9X7J6A3_9FIRM|nr:MULTISPECIES: glycosyltransferase [Moorella]PRR77049.1 D-inositol 3-phosphate glycosyltransferase [Moorella stamsii]CEP68824.1 Glycosyl transferase, family 1 [Moorella glycerini]